MDARLDQWIDLKRHPSTPAEFVRAVKVLVTRPPAGLHMSYRVDGEIPRILVPSPATPGFAADLWRHTCFEAFLSIEGQTAYREFNFSPSGEWALYAFSAYREGVPLTDPTMRPRIAVRSTAQRLELDAHLSRDAVSWIQRDCLLSVGLSAVIEASDGTSYWALCHPAGKPDFHDPDSFALRLESPSPG